MFLEQLVRTILFKCCYLNLPINILKEAYLEYSPNVTRPFVWSDSWGSSGNPSLFLSPHVFTSTDACTPPSVICPGNSADFGMANDNMASWPFRVYRGTGRVAFVKWSTNKVKQSAAVSARLCSPRRWGRCVSSAGYHLLSYLRLVEGPDDRVTVIGLAWRQQCADSLPVAAPSLAPSASGLASPAELII